MPIPAGMLTHKVRFERRASGEDEHGQEIDDWEIVATVRAWPIWGTGQERREAAQASASMPATFRVRESSDTRWLGPGARMRCDPARPVPDDWATAPAWDIRSVTRPEAGVLDVAAVRQVQ